MTNIAVKCGANGKAKVKGDVDGMVFVACRARLATSGIPISKFIEACMRSYAEQTFNLVDGKAVFPQQEHVTRVTHEAPKKVGRPSHKEVLEDITPEDNRKLPWHKQDPTKRTIEDYMTVVLPPLERDDAPNLLLSTEDENGKTWREYIEEDWLEQRLKLERDDFWFDDTLWMLVRCEEARFRNDGMRNYRFRQNETAQEIIDLNQELTIKYSDKIDEAAEKFKEARES